MRLRPGRRRLPSDPLPAGPRVGGRVSRNEDLRRHRRHLCVGARRPRGRWHRRGAICGRLHERLFVAARRCARASGPRADARDRAARGTPADASGVRASRLQVLEADPGPPRRRGRLARCRRRRGGRRRRAIERARPVHARRVPARVGDCRAGHASLGWNHGLLARRAAVRRTSTDRRVRACGLHRARHGVRAGYQLAACRARVWGDAARRDAVRSVASVAGAASYPRQVRRFRPGEAITWRSIAAREGVVGHAWPWTMVRDEADLIVLYMPAGASLKIRTGDFGGPRDRFLIRWDGGYRDNVWTGADVTLLHRPEDAHSVWLARDAETIRPLWWYVNLEEHWRRTAIGFDSRDQWLDLWADAERREGTWKDEDELQWAVEHEIIDAEAAAEVRREG